MIKYARRSLRGFVDEVVVPLIQYIHYKIPGTTVLRELEKRTAVECADYAQARMQAALQFERKEDLWNHALGKAPNGLLVEFGVWNGKSINHIARRSTPAIVYGFDSFEGLREDWSGWKETKGAFNRGGRLPKVEANVRLVKGWFDATLPQFLSDHSGPFAFVHFDGDTYESAKTILDLVGPRLVVGTVLVFDEYFGYRGWKIGEYRAWQEFVRKWGIEYEYLAFSDQPVALRIARK